ncbi:MAG: DegT/DnrJ/EryC1/StrS family aminotransferase [Solirubrobacterales bacterium]|nr:DegT/DnrJ/EryC1/StrS family aminotransferase [Solirubrobacterales bacterium]
MPLVALERQHARIANELKDTFARLLDSSAFTLGAELEQFESEFAQYCEVSHCVGVASGTAALSLMLRGYGIGPGDEVIVPAHTFIASALAVAQVRAVPVLCDVDDRTGLIDPDAARSAIGPCTAAILAVHLYGQTCDMAAIEAIAKPRSLLVLEDAAQAHGARYHRARAGSLGAAAAFSFYPSKNLGALGDGGAVCTNDEILASRLRRLRNLGQRAKGEHVELAGNERLDALQAALLRVKLRYLDGWNEERRRHAERYRESLPAASWLLAELPENQCVYHIFPARFRDRDAAAATLHEHGIATAVHYTPAVHQHMAWTKSLLRHDSLPVAERWAAEELSLPMHPNLLPAEIDQVCEALHAVHARWSA